jgi:signal transduction histidine kinase
LKRMAAHRLERSPLSLPELCGRAEALLRDALGERKVRIEIEPHVVVRCDQDKVLQVVVNLLSNALEAAGAQGHVGVSFAESSTGGELVVWDDGPGFVGDPARLFAPWVTTKPRGTGLGLAITQRLVRAHGWTVSARRRDERTVFVISVRKEDIVKPGSMHEQEKMDEVEVA